MPNQADIFNKSHRSGLNVMSEPSRLRAIAHLFGMAAEPVEQARILVIGRHIGSHVVALAAHYPQAVVVGVDADIQYVARIQRLIKKMALSNLILLHKELSDITTTLGKFDYILCTHFYSHISKAEKKILAGIFGQCLSEKGLAYVDYHTYPGWYGKKIWIDLMQYRAVKQTHWQDKVAYGRGMVQFVHQYADSVVQNLLEPYFDTIMNADDETIDESYFSGSQSADYVSHVAQSMRQQGLQWLAEADYRQHYHSRLPEQALAALRQECGDDRIRYAQLLDFICHTAMRHSIFCRQNQKLDTTGYLYQDMLDALHISGHFVYERTRNAWQSKQGGILFDNSVPELFAELNRRAPASISVSHFVRQYTTQKHDTAQTEAFYRLLAALVVHGAVDIRLTPLSLPVVVARKPQVLKALRVLAQHILDGAKDIVPLFTVQQAVFCYDSFTDARIVAALDGRKTVYEVQDILFQAAINGDFSFIDEKGQQITDKSQLRSLSDRQVRSTINALHQSGMLR